MTKVDLRSDTVTHPSPEMREAISQAEIGDDVFNDDPSVNKLEEMAAAIEREYLNASFIRNVTWSPTQM